jgi:hypothetical protein
LQFQKANPEIDKLRYYVGNRLRPRAIIAHYIPCIVAIFVVYFFPMVGILMTALTLLTSFFIK